MSRGLLIASVLSMALTVQGAHAADLSTPEAAVASFFGAYARHDIEGIVAARDFEFEARESLGEAASDSTRIDDETALRIAKALESAFRSRIQREGFPKVDEPQCVVLQSRPLQKNVVQLIRMCPSPAGGTMFGSILVTKSGKGWGVVLSLGAASSRSSP